MSRLVSNKHEFTVVHIAFLTLLYCNECANAGTVGILPQCTEPGCLAAIPTITADLTKTTVNYMIYVYYTAILTDLEVLR